MDTLGKRIKYARGAASQDSFSAEINISKGSLGGYERDENLPNTDTVLKICQKTGISLEWLLTGQGHAYPEHITKEEPASAIPHSGLLERMEKRFAALEEERRLLNEERRELNTENRRLNRENAELRERIAELRERVARLEGALNKPDSGHPAETAVSVA